MVFKSDGRSRGAASVRQAKNMEMNGIAIEERKTEQIHLAAMLS